ncbi:MAG: DNA/RNA non-specific endonuclease [Lachnospiraceae bacterium]|nr:DNA/RNA non-specific endonuclease [Lachnospiraceae bacterium]
MKKIKTQRLLYLVLGFILIVCLNTVTAYADEDTAGSDKAVYLQDLEEFRYDEIPEYQGIPYAEIHENQPYFSDDELTTVAAESYSHTDRFDRCGSAYAVVGREIMPTEERGEIGSVRPAGWHTIKYPETVIPDLYLYNRCHLIAYELTGENANTENLITGTRYMNVSGMLPFENEVADYVERTDHHVLYRVTPVFKGSDLLARGVLMEARSVEDDDVSFCVFCYNVQPGITIDYRSGASTLNRDAEAEAAAAEEAWAAFEAKKADESAQDQSDTENDTGSDAETEESERISDEPAADEGQTYILNTNTKKFHYPHCGSVQQMKEKNKREYEGTRDEVIAMGYSPCKNCNP